MKRIAIATILLISSIATYSSESGKQMAGKFNDYTVSYILPKTVIDIDIELKQTQKTAGPYANYSQKYLGVPAKVSENSNKWEVVSISATVSSLPDKDIYYAIQLKSAESPYIYVNEEGILMAVNAEPQFDEELKEENVVKVQKSPLEDNTYSLAFTEEMLLSGSNIRMAELAAKQIYRIRESRTDIITGESDQKFDGEALKLMLQQLDEQENRLSVMFTGTTTTQKKSVRVRWIPQGECEDVVVARISEIEGLVGADNLSGEPIYISLSNVVRATAPLDAKGNPIVLPENSIIYNIPGEALMSLKYQGKTLDEKRVQLTQFGIKFGLAPKLFVDKKKPAYLILHPNTGAIKEVGQNTIVK